MRAPVDIRLGERAYTIRPLTLGQVEAIESAILAGERAHIIKAALSRDHASVDLDDMSVLAPDVTAAINAILSLTGSERAAQTEKPSPRTADPWRQIRCRLISNNVVDIDRVDDVEWWRVREILTFWREQPPLHDLVECIARFLGYTPPTPASVGDNDAALAELMCAYPDGMIRGGA